MVIHTNDEVNIPPEQTGTLSQTCSHSDPNQIFDLLNAYWVPFWQRDPQVDTVSPEDLSCFHDLLRQVPPMPNIAVQEADVNEWLLAIKHTKPHTAPGVDGIRASELQLLPTCLIQDLENIATKDAQVVPTNWVKGRTFPLSKQWGLCSADQTRPIIPRLWGKVITRQLIPWSMVHLRFSQRP